MVEQVAVQAGPKKIVFDNYDSTIIEIQQPMENLRVFKFKLEGEKRINFTAGQYVSVIYPGAHPAPFSIASSPENHEVVELGIEITGGPVTSRLKLANVGDKAILRGPFGNFVMQGEKKVCYLAGGVGITPFMCMLRWIRDTHQDGVNAVLFYSCKVQEQFLWVPELEQMAREHPNIKIVLTITRDVPPGWTHHSGRINEQMIREEMPDFAERTFYSCGPPALIDAMFGLLKTMGVTDDKLKKEKW
jgi:glycine betaine catabolism B